MACKTLAVAARFPAAALLRLRCSPAHLRLAGFCHHRRGIAMVASSSSTMPHASAPVSDPLPKGADLFIRSVMSNMLEVYLSRNSTAKTILDIVRSYDGDNICYDHFAFRTFGVDGYGINSLAEIFTDFGYVPREELRFPAKKLRALWFSPPTNDGYSKAGIYGPLPRIFISELLVDELSAQSQEIVHKYIKTSGKGNKHAVLASTSGELTWEKPIYSDFQILSSESEYAAWTLVNGYALNHATIATHRLESDIRSISKFNKFMEDNGFKLNSEGGILKVSPDGLLQQSSTVADSELFKFADGMTKSIPRSYIEFAERLPLPHFKDLRNEEWYQSLVTDLILVLVMGEEAKATTASGIFHTAVRVVTCAVADPTRPQSPATEPEISAICTEATVQQQHQATAIDRIRNFFFY